MAFDSRLGVLWTAVIAVDFFWLTNPVVFMNFTDSLRNACAVTLGAMVLTPLRRVPRLPWTVLAVVGFLFLTLLWSTFSRFTMHVALLYLAIAVLGLVIAATVDARTLAHGMMLGGVVVVALSIYAYRIELPGSAASPGEGYLAGVGSNRNILSYTMVLALAFAISFLPRTWLGRLLWLGGTSTILLGLFLTQSATGFVAASALIGMAFVMAVRDRAIARTEDPAHRVGWLLRVAPVAVLAASTVVLAALIQIRGRDAGTVTFTGRTPLWSATWHATDGWDRWFGAGWGVVWPHPWFPAGANDLYAEITARAEIAMSHGHNSVMDLLPEVGLIGILLWAAAYAQAAARGLDARRVAAAPDAARLTASRAVLLPLFALLVYGLTEPLSTIPFGWWILVMLATGIAAEARPLREAAPSAVSDPA